MGRSNNQLDVAEFFSLTIPPTPTGLWKNLVADRPALDGDKAMLDEVHDAGQAAREYACASAVRCIWRHRLAALNGEPVSGALLYCGLTHNKPLPSGQSTEALRRRSGRRLCLLAVWVC